MLFLLKECYQTCYAVTIKIRETVKNQSAKGTEMTDSIRNSSKKKKKKKKKKNLNFYKTFTRRTHNGICIKPLQEEHITGLSERLTKR